MSFNRFYSNADDPKNKTENNSENTITNGTVLHSSRNANENAIQSSRGNLREKHIFVKGMEIKDIKVNIFLLEGRSGFERLCLREKQTVLINESDWKIKEWFFDLG